MKMETDLPDYSYAVQIISMPSQAMLESEAKGREKKFSPHLKI